MKILRIFPLLLLAFAACDDRREEMIESIEEEAPDAQATQPMVADTLQVEVEEDTPAVR